MKRPSIHQLEVFCKVVQFGSMARAAEDLQVSPSSVSMQIQELERRFRTPLLVRGPRRTVPTAGGIALYKHAQALLDGLNAVERELGELGSLKSGTLRFATSRTIGAGVVRPVLQLFERAHPQVDVSYHVMASSQQAQTEVLTERAEFAFVGRVGPDWHLDVRPLFHEPLLVVIAPSHPMASESGLTIDTLGGHTLLLREPPVLGHHEVLRLLEDAGATPTIVELGSTEAVKAEALAGNGVAILPRTTVAEDIASGALLRCCVEGFQPHRTVYVTSLSNTPLSPVAESFVRLARTVCGKPN
jgi:DNA-binding transcriptional LysR family regulator